MNSTIDPPLSGSYEFEKNNLLENKENPGEADEKRASSLLLEETAYYSPETVGKNTCVVDGETSQRINVIQSDKEKEPSALPGFNEGQEGKLHLGESLTAEMEKPSGGDNDEIDEANSQESQTIVSDDDSMTISFSESTETEPVLLKVSNVIGINLANVSLVGFILL